jgi:hypothetical protein
MFINFYEIKEYRPDGNIVEPIGYYEHFSEKEIKEALKVFKSLSKYQDPKFSLQIQDFNAWKKFKSEKENFSL